MKKIIVLTVFLVAGFVFQTQAQANFKFEKTQHDFGTVKPGTDTLWVDFKFTNDGSEALKISDVKTSCDCTLAKWPTGAIAPNKSDVIHAGFKIEGKSGPFNKNVIILGNTMPGTTILTIKGNIE